MSESLGEQLRREFLEAHEMTPAQALDWLLDHPGATVAESVDAHALLTAALGYLQTFREREPYVSGLIDCIRTGAPREVLEYEAESVVYDDDDRKTPWFPAPDIPSLYSPVGPYDDTTYGPHCLCPNCREPTPPRASPRAVSSSSAESTVPTP